MPVVNSNGAAPPVTSDVLTGGDSFKGHAARAVLCGIAAGIALFAAGLGALIMGCPILDRDTTHPF